MKAFINIVLFSLLISTISCKQEYPLPKETNDLDLLVVEGLLNSSGPTVVRLSRTFNPTDIGTVLPVANAEVTVEGEDNTMFFLPGNNAFTPVADRFVTVETFKNPERAQVAPTSDFGLSLQQPVPFL